MILIKADAPRRRQTGVMTMTTIPAELRVEALPGDDAGAWALARTWRPDLAEQDWRGFVDRWLAGGGERGLLTARSARGGVLGFVTWWTQPDLDRGEVLLAGPFVVRELGVRPLVQQALLKQLGAMARERTLSLRVLDSAPTDERG